MVVVGDAIAIALRRAVFLVRTESLSVLDRLCQVSVPARHFGSGTCTTLLRGLGRGVDPVWFATGVGESSVSLDRIVFDRVDSEQPTVM